MQSSCLTGWRLTRARCTAGWTHSSAHALRMITTPAVRAVAAGDPRAIAAALSNDFDALTSSPLAELLRTHGALGAMLTGSGSAAFGIFADAAAAEACTAVLGGCVQFARHVVLHSKESET